jgi:UDP-galactose transporter B1
MSYQHQQHQQHQQQHHHHQQDTSSTSSQDTAHTHETFSDHSDSLSHDHTDDDDDDNIVDNYELSSKASKASVLRRRHPKNNLKSKIKNKRANTNQSDAVHKGYNNNNSNNNSNNNGNKAFLLLICASGICTCYLYYGMIQERLFSKSSSSDSPMKQCGNTTTFMLVLGCMTNVAVSNLWIWVQSHLSRLSSSSSSKEDHDDYIDNDDSTRTSTSTSDNEVKLQLNHQLFFYSAFCFFAAMTASNESLGHVSYPTAVLAKSSKLIPTMLVGYFMERKSFLVKEWFSAALITIGIILFNLSRMHANATANANANKQQQDTQQEKEDSTYGLFLLAFSLGMDGLLASCQNRLKKRNEVLSSSSSSSTKEKRDTMKYRYRQPTALETMLWINAYALVFLLPLSIYSGQFANGIKLLTLPSSSSSLSPSSSSSISIRQTIITLNLTAAMGQIFIFFTIQLFSPLMCTTITTTRKFLTILLSVWKFGHTFTTVQWFSIFMVFGGLYLGIVSKFVGGSGSGSGSSSTTTTKHGKSGTNKSVTANPSKESMKRKTR